jgi:uroporphyrinogen-III synthase
MRKVLHLGLTAPPFAVHYPVIRTERIDSEKLKRAMSELDRFTHLIFTSKQGVFHWCEVASVSGKESIAIGKATAKAIEEKGGRVAIAPFATQEGIISLLSQEKMKGCYLYLRSSFARPLLANFLQENRIDHETVDLYQTIYQRPLPLPNLLEFDEIVFTSPSTVQGFLNIFGTLPKGPLLTPIGPITKEALSKEKNKDELFQEKFEELYQTASYF